MKERKILTVSLNPAVDLSYGVNGLAMGGVHMQSAVGRVAGGEANNVARVLAALGLSVIATGLAGGETGQWLQAELRQSGVEVAFVAVAGQNRTAEEYSRLLTRFRNLLPQTELVIVSGSLPPGIADKFYGLLVREVYRQVQGRTIVDATGAALQGVLQAQPYMVKVNLVELAEWAKEPLTDEVSVVQAASKLVAEGPLVAAVSLGEAGLVLVSPQGAWRAVPPPIQPINTIGCGDSLVAGLAAGLVQGLPAEEVLQLAVACGTACALSSSAGLIVIDQMINLKEHVQVERI